MRALGNLILDTAKKEGMHESPDVVDIYIDGNDKGYAIWDSGKGEYRLVSKNIKKMSFSTAELLQAFRDLTKQDTKKRKYLYHGELYDY